MCSVPCEDCVFANWDYTLFRDGDDHWEGNHHVEPYTEQFDLYCSKHNRFLLEDEIDGSCTDGVRGKNNYHDTVMRYYEERDEYMKELKKLARCNELCDLSR